VAGQYVRHPANNLFLQDVKGDLSSVLGCVDYYSWSCARKQKLFSFPRLQNEYASRTGQKTVTSLPGLLMRRMHMHAAVQTSLNAA
jgi:hypothetical protein